MRRFILEAVPLQAPRDEGIVERPGGADVVADGVVAAFPLGQRANTPAREEARATLLARDCGRPRLIDDAAPKQVANVRGQGVDLAAVSVERQRVVLSALDPRVATEVMLEFVRFALELVGVLRVVPYSTCQPGAAHLGVVGVTLELAGRAREAGQLPVATRDRVPGVLPALVLEAGLLVAALVGDVADSQRISLCVDPVHCGACLGLKGADEVGVAATREPSGRCVRGSTSVGPMAPLRHRVERGDRRWQLAVPATTPRTSFVVCARASVIREVATRRCTRALCAGCRASSYRRVPAGARTRLLEVACHPLDERCWVRGAMGPL